MIRKLPPPVSGDAFWVMRLSLLVLMILIYCRNSLSQSSEPTLTRQIGLKVYYFRSIRQEINDGLNAVQIVPGIADARGRINLTLPVGLFQELILEPPKEKTSEIMLFFTPRITCNIFNKRNLLVYTGAYSEIMIDNWHRACPFYGFATGFGWCDRLRNLYFRTEIGADLYCRGIWHPVLNIGISIGYRLGSFRSRSRIITPQQDRFLSSFSKAAALYSGKRE